MREKRKCRTLYRRNFTRQVECAEHSPQNFTSNASCKIAEVLCRDLTILRCFWPISRQPRKLRSQHFGAPMEMRGHWMRCLVHLPSHSRIGDTCTRVLRSPVSIRNLMPFIGSCGSSFSDFIPIGNGMIRNFVYPHPQLIKAKPHTAFRSVWQSVVDNQRPIPRLMWR